MILPQNDSSESSDDENARILDYSQYYKVDIFEEKYNPGYMSEQTTRNSAYISLIFCFVIVVVVFLVVFCGGLFLLFFGVTTRKRAVLSYNNNIGIWMGNIGSKDYRNNFDKNGQRKFISYWINNGNKETLNLIKNETLFKINDNDPSLSDYKENYYLNNGYFTFFKDLEFNTESSGVFEIYNRDTQIGNQTIRLFLESEVKLSQEECKNEKGEFIEKDNICSIKWILSGLCAVSSGGGLQNLKNGKQNGCYRETDKYFPIGRDYWIGQYEKIESFKKRYTCTGKIFFHSVYDPYLLFYESSGGTLKFGNNFGTPFICGVSCICVSVIIIFCSTCFYIGASKTTKKKVKEERDLYINSDDSHLGEKIGNQGSSYQQFESTK